ncbi:MAG: hypothetical protein JSW00_09125 [Thermoplasmata archaeon]|nr:MAG: hypothetical protein JSW00_09125 [Thermoplasmata archaeon]
MRKYIAILGTLLIATILLSGSAVAQRWHYVDIVDSHTNCENEDDACGVPDNKYATVGTNFPSPTLGNLVLDLSEANLMGPNQDFTVYHQSNTNETYYISVITDDKTVESTAWLGWDTENLVFTTPSNEGLLWRYFNIEGETGEIEFGELEDIIYGPEINAIGWYG